MAITSTIGDENWGWDEFRSLVEERFAKARRMDLADAPIPLVGHEAVLWLRSKVETLQWVLEMMPEAAPAPEPISSTAQLRR